MAKKVLMCMLCSYSVEDKKVIHSYETNSTKSVLHCMQCLSLHAPKKRTVKKWLQMMLKKPFMAKYFFKRERGCCEASSSIEWNGRCPKCGSELTLTYKAAA